MFKSRPRLNNRALPTRRLNPENKLTGITKKKSLKQQISQSQEGGSIKNKSGMSNMNMMNELKTRFANSNKFQNKDNSVLIGNNGREKKRTFVLHYNYI